MKFSLLIRLILFFSLIGALALTAPRGAGAWTNPSFETGTLAGWTTNTGNAGGLACGNPTISVVNVGGGPAPDSVGPLTPAGLPLVGAGNGNYAVQLFSSRGDPNYADWAQVCQSDTVPTGGVSCCLSFWVAALLEDYHYVQQNDTFGDAYVEADVIIGGGACGAGGVTVASLRYGWGYDVGTGLLQITGAGQWAGNYPGCAISQTPYPDWGFIPWTQQTVNLCAYAGQKVSLVVTAFDCDGDGHYSLGYLDNVSWQTCVTPQFTVSKSVNPTGNVNAGDTLTYTISYANTGAVPIDGVQICDTIPADVKMLKTPGPASTPALGAVTFTGTSPGDTICWDVGYVPAGGSGTLSFAVTVDKPCSIITNQAWETDAQTSGQTTNAVTNIVDGCTPTKTPKTTPTFTDTPTYTSTNTITNTATPTATLTDTNSPTNTATRTDTNTATNTATVTDTNTATNTATNTVINTATNTATVTDTNTATNTATNTVINTPTNTATVTDTNTATNSATTTIQNTSTDTATPTATHTPTNSPVNTYTSTNTATTTDTNTATSTSTNTVINTPTPTATLTPTNTSTNTPVNTNTSTNTATPTDTNTATATPTRTATHTATMTATHTTVNTATNTMTSTLTVTPTATATLTATPTPAAGVTTPGAYTVNIDIYNSAGEVVKVIPVQSEAQPINNITLSTSNVITTLRGSGSTIGIYYNGTLIGTWDGSNNSGNPVTNGNYSIKVDSVSAQGVVTSVEQDAAVNRALSRISVSVFNSAGEAVRNLYSLVGEGNNSQMTSANLSANVITLGPGSGGSASLLKLVVDSTGGTPVTLTWDGTNDSATDVTPGTYTIQLHWDDGEGQTSDITRSVIVLGSGAIGAVLAEPNVLTNGQTTTTFNGTGISNAWILTVNVYTISGELVKFIPGPPGAATAQWNAAGLASGIYIAAVQARDSNGGVLENQILKLLVIH